MNNITLLGPLSDRQYVVRLFSLTDVLINNAESIYQVIDKIGEAWLFALDISRAFEMV